MPLHVFAVTSARSLAGDWNCARHFDWLAIWRRQPVLLQCRSVPASVHHDAVQTRDALFRSQFRLGPVMSLFGWWSCEFKESNGLLRASAFMRGVAQPRKKDWLINHQAQRSCRNLISMEWTASIANVSLKFNQQVNGQCHITIIATRSEHCYSAHET